MGYTNAFYFNKVKLVSFLGHDIYFAPRLKVVTFKHAISPIL